MSKSELLYVKGMNSSDTDTVEDDIWDDKKLNDAYDKALKMANIEVAKRIAMSTNTEGKKEVSDHPKNKRERVSSRPTSSKKPIEWKAGMPCRAVYGKDGQEYEAFLLNIIDDKECVVRYLGYENTEIVSVSSLKPTLGSDERTRQIEQALYDEGEDGFDSQTLGSDMERSVKSNDISHSKKKSKNRKKHSRLNNGFDLPQMPVTSMIKNLGPMDMPMPPPPPINFEKQDRSDQEDQAISSMLLSWYMSGYYTGLYQGMKRAKESRRNL